MAAINGKAYAQVLLSFLAFVSLPSFARELLDSEKAVIEKAVRGSLIDSESARFKWVPIASPEVKTYCGLVNARNRFGGYTGDAPYAVFVVWKEQAIVMAVLLRIGTNSPTSPSSIAVMKVCEDNGYTKLFMAE